MDDLIVTGTIAVGIVYAGIVCIAIAVFLVVYNLVQAILSGNYDALVMLVAGIFAAGVVYGGIGLMLRRKGIV
ncbi:MAG: hypothetical protein NTZ39_03165 [Methanoregula sp.]|nr:hypothetical protein [Methanoregula sp.]